MPACYYCGRPADFVDDDGLSVCRLHHELYLSSETGQLDKIRDAASILGWPMRFYNGSWWVELPPALIVWNGERYRFGDVRFELFYGSKRARLAGELYWRLYAGLRIDDGGVAMPEEQGGRWHPHASQGGAMCTGSGGSGITRLLNRGDFVGMFVQARIVTCQYNPHDCYYPLTPLMCNSCEHETDSIVMYHCMRCGSWICRSCIGYYEQPPEPGPYEVDDCMLCVVNCPECGESVDNPRAWPMEDVLTSCPGCRSWVCDNCLYRCDSCGKLTTCVRCYTECDDCNAQLCPHCAVNYLGGLLCPDCHTAVCVAEEEDREAQREFSRRRRAALLSDLERCFESEEPYVQEEIEGLAESPAAEGEGFITEGPAVEGADSEPFFLDPSGVPF